MSKLIRRMFIMPDGRAVPLIKMPLQFFADGAEKNIVTFGLENCYWAKATFDPTAMTVTYGEPARWPGATELNLEINGELIEFEADNIVYYTSADNKGYTGTFTSALIPNEFETECLGEEIDVEDQVQTEVSNGKTSPFALMFQFEGDKKAVRHVLYYCNANRPGLASGTGKNINTTELNFNATPRPSDKKVKTKTKENTPAAIYDGWFTKVYEKVAVA